MTSQRLKTTKKMIDRLACGLSSKPLSECQKASTLRGHGAEISVKVLGLPLYFEFICKQLLHTVPKQNLE
jgi:hypothetical protein